MSAPISIEQEVRVIGIAMAQCVFSDGPPSNQVWADCTECDQSIVARFDSREEAMRWSDKDAEREFRKRGWSIKPTLCPEHNKVGTTTAPQ